MQNLPTGTVTFLFTDIEGSTRLWQEKPQVMAISHAWHNEILQNTIEAHHGYVFQTAGDSFSAAFHNARDGLCAALAAQRRLRDKMQEIRVRMGLHTGAAEVFLEGDRPTYSGYTTVAATQRVMSVAHGGQVLLSQTTHDLVQNDLPKDASLRDMGEHLLKDLRMPFRLYQLVAPDLPSDFPPIQSPNFTPNNLPLQLTSFVGREKEIAEIKALLNLNRLVTLTGSGGTGKTRLSQEVSAQVLQNFPQGVWLFELASLTEPAQIIPAMAHVLGLQELPFQQLTVLVTNYLREKRSLLILDNCEHLIEACARLADELLHQCADLKILASSREALGIAGEVAYRIPSLAKTESAQLFVERARASNPKFQLTDANITSIAQICSRLDGIPLAIELAAARIRLLSPEQIASKLDDRFRLLVGGSRTALPRQQTLRALIDWSYDLLSDDEKRLLQFASVFIGGWTLDALESVADDPNTIEYLEGLVNKSLVVTEERNDEMRYFMLETIRQYAREKLFEANRSSTARDRHFTYFDKLSEKLWNEFRSANAQHVRDKTQDDVENFRTALEWGMNHHEEDALNLATNFCLATSWFGMQTEGRVLLKSALEKMDALPPVDGDAKIHRQKTIAKALFAEGMVGVGQGDSILAAKALQEAIRISRVTGDKLILGYSLEMYFIASEFAKMPGGQEAVEEGQSILNELGDTWGIFMVNQNKARLATFQGNFDERQFYLGKNRALMQKMPLSFQAAMFYLGAGMDERFRGNRQAARPYFEEGLKAFQKLHHRNFENVMRSELGHIARLDGDMALARQIYQKTLVNWRDLGHRSAIANQLECFAFIAIAEEEPKRAAKLLGSAESLRESIGSPMAKYEESEYEQFVAQLRDMLPDADLAELWDEGRAMSMEQAIQLALS